MNEIDPRDCSGGWADADAEADCKFVYVVTVNDIVIGVTTNAGKSLKWVDLAERRDESAAVRQWRCKVHE